MTHCVFGIIIAIMLLAGATPGWSLQQYLYAPKPVGVGEKVQKGDGVLVQEIEVRKGDTLSGISRRFSGHGSYFPQILLFNDLKNPDRIYPGNVLRIPASRSRVTEQAAADPVGNPNKNTAVQGLKRRQKHEVAAPSTIQAARPLTAPVTSTAEQRLFERAIKAYRQNDCRTALALFDRFLAEHPSSALAADASLYKAECYLKQSNQ